MTARLGIELAPDQVRVVRIDGWPKLRIQTFEVAWDPEEPGKAMASIREALGNARRMAVAVDLSFLYVKRVRLPPVSPAEKRRILNLEPDRFFPVRAEELVLAVRAEDNLVFAVRADPLAAWIEALETVAPVDRVEPGPVALGRALARGDIRDTTVLQEEPDGIGVTELRGGRVHQVRRLGSDPTELQAALEERASGGSAVWVRPLNGNRAWSPAVGHHQLDLRALPAIAGVGSQFLVALGAALGLGEPIVEALLPADLARRIGRRRWREVAWASAACGVALGLLLLSLDGFRARTLSALDREIAALGDTGETILRLRTEAARLGQESRAVARLAAERPDPVQALIGLTNRLPEGAHLRALQSTGGDWQIDGYARDAAPLVPLLENDSLFDNVHFLSATSRTLVGGSTYESFSIAFRVVPAP